MEHPQMTNLSATDLETVTGGVATATTTSNCLGGFGTGSDALMATLMSLQNSIQQMSCSNNQGLFGGNNSTFLLLAMAMCMNRNTSVYYGGGGPPPWGGYYYRY
jgi:hypothetical protein